MSGARAAVGAGWLREDEVSFSEAFLVSLTRALYFFSFSSRSDKVYFIFFMLQDELSISLALAWHCHFLASSQVGARDARIVD